MTDGSYFDSEDKSRRWPRRSHSSRVVMFHVDQTWIAKTMQISPGGMLITSSRLLRKADLVTVHFIIYGSYIRTHAEVIYVIPDAHDPGSVKLGLSFGSLTESDRETLERFASEGHVQ